MMITKKNALILAAHPDDETLGCGATIARLSAEGYEINVITFTDGVSARESVRENTAPYRKIPDEVIKILGITNVNSSSNSITIHFPDNAMDSVPLLSVCKYIEKNVCRTLNLIFTHHPDCLNIDHQVVYRATITVFRPQVGNAFDILSYYVPSSTDYNPLNNFVGNVYYNVSDTIDKKLEALKYYSEEMREHPHSRSRENILNIARVNGAEVGMQYAEKFQIIRSIK